MDAVSPVRPEILARLEDAPADGTIDTVLRDLLRDTRYTGNEVKAALSEHERRKEERARQQPQQPVAQNSSSTSTTALRLSSQQFPPPENDSQSSLPVLGDSQGSELDPQNQSWLSEQSSSILSDLPLPDVDSHPLSKSREEKERKCLAFFTTLEQLADSTRDDKVAFLCVKRIDRRYKIIWVPEQHGGGKSGDGGQRRRTLPPVLYNVLLLSAEDMISGKASAPPKKGDGKPYKYDNSLFTLLRGLVNLGKHIGDTMDVPTKDGKRQKVQRHREAITFVENYYWGRREPKIDQTGTADWPSPKIQFIYWAQREMNSVMECVSGPRNAELRDLVKELVGDINTHKANDRKWGKEHREKHTVDIRIGVGWGVVLVEFVRRLGVSLFYVVD